MSLPESLERAASELAALADQIRPANGDPHRLLDELSAGEGGQLLVWMLTEEADSAAELIEVWCESDQGAAIILSASDEGIPKVARRALRKARHRLRSQGVEAAISAPAPTIPKTRRVSNSKDRWQVAHVSTLDFRGGRVGYLVDSHPSGGARLFEIRFDESRGIHDFKIYNAGRSKVREFLRSLTGGSEQRLFEVDRDALRALVRRASLAQPVDRPLPSAFIEWRGRLFQEELEKQATPGELARTALAGRMDSVDADEARRATLVEIRDGGLGPWPPATAWVSEWMSSGREAVDGLDGAARSKAIDSWLAAATESLSTETDTSLLTRHLDELAWIRWQSEEESGALSLLSVSGTLVADDEARNQISRARVEGLFASFLAELRVVEIDGLASSEAPVAADQASK